MSKKLVIFVLCIVLSFAALTACGSGGNSPTAASKIEISLDKGTYSATDDIIITIKNSTSAASTYTDEVDVLIEEGHDDHSHWNPAKWKNTVDFSTETKTLEAGSEVTQTIKLSDLASKLKAGTYQIAKLIGATEYKAIFIVE